MQSVGQAIQKLHTKND